MFARSVSAVNCVLMLHADVPLSIGKIAKAASLAYAPARSAIETLEKRGLAVRSQRAGQDEFAPDLQSPYYPAAYLAALVDLPIEPAIGRNRPLHAAYAYGSLSRAGGGSPTSDVDLLLITRVRDDDDRERIRHDLEIGLGQALHRPIDAWILSQAEADQLERAGDAHLVEAVAGVRLRRGR